MNLSIIHSRSKEKDGFTLVEILVTLTIFGGDLACTFAGVYDRCTQSGTFR